MHPKIRAAFGAQCLVAVCGVLASCGGRQASVQLETSQESKSAGLELLSAGDVPRRLLVVRPGAPQRERVWHGVWSNLEGSSSSYLEELELEYAGTGDGCFHLVQHGLIREGGYSPGGDMYVERFCAPYVQLSGEAWEVIARPNVEVGRGAVWVERAPAKGLRMWPQYKLVELLGFDQESAVLLVEVFGRYPLVVFQPHDSPHTGAPDIVRLTCSYGWGVVRVRADDSLWEGYLVDFGVAELSFSGQMSDQVPYRQELRGRRAGKPPPLEVMVDEGREWATRSKYGIDDGAWRIYQEIPRSKPNLGMYEACEYADAAYERVRRRGGL